MAWPKDKEPYNQFAKGSPLVKGQTRMEDAAKRVGQGAVQGARKLVSENFGGKYVQAATSPLVNRLSQDAAKQNKIMAVEENKAKTRNNFLAVGDRRVNVSYNPPNPNYPSARQMLAKPPQQSSQNTVPQNIDNSGGFMRNSAGKTASFRNGRMIVRDERGNVIPEKPLNTISSMPQRPQDNGYAISNVGPMAEGGRQALFAPSQNRIQGIDQDIQDRYDRLHQEQYMQRITGGGFAPIHSQSSGRYFGPSPLPGENKGEQIPELIGKESGMGWKSRLSLNEKIMDRWNDQENNQASMARERLQSGTQRDISRENNNTQFGIEQSRQEAEAPMKAAQTRGYTATAVGQERTNRSAGQIESLTNRYLAAKTPEESQDLENKLMVMLGKSDPNGQWVDGDEEEILDETGNPTGDVKKTKVFQDSTGQIRTLKDMLYEQESLKLLRNRQMTPQQFKERFGYTPSGI